MCRMTTPELHFLSEFAATVAIFPVGVKSRRPRGIKSSTSLAAGLIVVPFKTDTIQRQSLCYKTFELYKQNNGT